MDTSDNQVVMVGDTVELRAVAKRRALDPHRGKRGVVESCDGAVVRVRFEGVLATLPRKVLRVVNGDPSRFVLGAPARAVVSRRPLPLFLRRHGASVDGHAFQARLAASISLTKDEKRCILVKLPLLKQHQVDQLLDIFGEEEQKFARLCADAPRHRPQVGRLERKHAADWMVLLDELEIAGWHSYWGSVPDKGDGVAFLTEDEVEAFGAEMG